MDTEVYNAAVNGSVNGLQGTWMCMKTPVGNNVLHVHVGKALRGEAAENVSVTFIQHVRNNDPAGQDSLLLETNDDGDTPLHLAARFGHSGAVQEFLRRPEEMNDTTRLLLNKANSNNNTALHEAARAGCAPVVRLLVEKDPENSVQYMPNDADETPLYLAAEKGCVRCFSSILDACSRLGLRLDHKGPCGLTALHIAVLCRNEGIVEKILQTNNTSSLLIKVKNKEGQTPLHSAAAQNVHNFRILELLLNYDDQFNSAAYIQDVKGRTALHLATLSWNFKGVQMIIRSYPSSIEITDLSKQNVVHYAANLGCLYRFREFLEHASPSCDMLINNTDNNGDTPLHVLASTTPSLPSHDCFVHLAELITQYDYVLDLKIYNHQDLTAGDIIASNRSLRHLGAVLRSEMAKTLPRGRRRNSNNGSGSNGAEDEKNMNLKKVENRIMNLKKANETRLVVAALIATVSFTAGFTVPGGFYQSGVRNTGLALLAKHGLFQAFLISDTIAFTLSSLAIICYFVVARNDALVTVDNLSASANLLSTVSLGSLMVAFMTGVCAVVAHTPGLIATVVVLCIFFFLFYLTLLRGTIGALLAFMTRNSSKKARE